jgi:hypothetical protein
VVKEIIESRLKKKGLPEETKAYEKEGYVEPLETPQENG